MRQFQASPVLDHCSLHRLERAPSMPRSSPLHFWAVVKKKLKPKIWVPPRSVRLPKWRKQRAQESLVKEMNKKQWHHRTLKEQVESFPMPAYGTISMRQIRWTSWWSTRRKSRSSKKQLRAMVVAACWFCMVHQALAKTLLWKLIVRRMQWNLSNIWTWTQLI